ncbi:hypothetical protein D7X94_03110 [Acutalibacter sp. 1XD8-33]|uniref:DUF6171 family protein n=1 Tax=Acutalibacter sp. 1XD8-33 TaxID=2320081 RepID=UPI000EA34292|nr:DUF6171 family protein [Acutalibacter sp. 1XD8-33]RKJ41816.1 hypothetical protein D7X94_03110 [Acutalibacter sp. 1XD8-33]
MDFQQKSRPACKRCFLNELDGEYFKSIYQYINNIPREQKAPTEEYVRRLAICKSCGDLKNGMCAQCGCFAEVRAAKKGQTCPNSRWGPQQEE